MLQDTSLSNLTTKISKVINTLSRIKHRLLNQVILLNEALIK
ncbi:Hypothetical protein ETEE_0978 [Edwardsiella anguillarum ET080813]|uniref:Uncharacterized protein n=1 Tax=Edwardsiella anguillarum ET080813 TaxID=667120 RepID=A0A076LL31_9GAMM|nr:Hypothetical protein ETEE_0978 [Edwardsiella anguillarum ET080813]